MAVLKPSVSPVSGRVCAGVLLVAALAVLPSLTLGSMSAMTSARAIPPPEVDVPAGRVSSAVAILAAGCFWGVQGVYQHVSGVKHAASGYAGGDSRTASYDLVSAGSTKHAESVEITFDPQVITYGRLLQIYFSVAHDPTQLNRQGPDVGPQYRSAIFPVNDEQARVARAYIAQLNRARAFDAAIVTTIEPGHRFHLAEDYHQDFLVRNPTNRYIVVHDLPKIDDLKRFFPNVYRARPVLVNPSGAR